jgi:hypothetical protein
MRSSQESLTRTPAPVVDDVLDSLGRLLIRSGVPKKDVAVRSARSVRRLPETQRDVPTGALACLQYGTHVITHWHAEPAYLDPNGRPRPLPLRGPDSVESLARLASPTVDAALMLSHLQRHQAIRRRGKLWVPAGHSVRFGPETLEQHLHGLVVLRGLLGTLDRNASRRRGTRPFFERVAENANVPISARAVVLRNAHRTGLQTLERIDLDMKRRERADLPAPRKSHLAVGMYVYEADAPIGLASPRIRSRSRARR